MVLLIVSVEKASEPAEATFSFSARAAGLESSSEQYGISIVDLTTGQEEPFSTCGATDITGTVTVGPRQIVAVKVAASSH